MARGTSHFYSFFSYDHNAQDQIHADIKTCNIVEPQHNIEPGDNTGKLSKQVIHLSLRPRNVRYLQKLSAEQYLHVISHNTIGI